MKSRKLKICKIKPVRHFIRTKKKKKKKPNYQSSTKGKIGECVNIRRKMKLLKWSVSTRHRKKRSRRWGTNWSRRKGQRRWHRGREYRQSGRNRKASWCFPGKPFWGAEAPGFSRRGGEILSWFSWETNRD